MKREPVEMTREGVIQSVALSFDARIDTAPQCFGMGDHRDQRIHRPIGAKGVAGENNRPPLGREIDHQITRPLLAGLGRY